MKRILETIDIIILLIILAVLSADGAPPGSLRTNITLQIDYPTNQLSTNLVFKIYSTTNLALAVSSWPLEKTFVGTNTTFTLPIIASQRFYVMTSSNWWGESDFSNVAQTPPLPLDVVNLRLGP